MTRTNQRWWDLPAAILFIGAMFTAAIRLRATNWTPGLYAVEFLVLSGSILGLLLGASKFSSLLSKVIGLIFTAYFVISQTGLVLGTDPIWSDRLVNLFDRFQVSFSHFTHNQAVSDPILFFLNMILFFWLLAFMGGYRLTRNGRPWQTLVITGIALLIIDYFSRDLPGRGWYAAVFTMFSLLLLTRMYFLQSRRRWVTNDISYDSSISFDFARGAVAVGLAIVMASWSMPVFVQAFTPGSEVQDQINQAWEDIRSRLSNMVTGLSGSPTEAAAFFSSDMTLGTGAQLGEDKVFNVKVTNQDAEGVRFYWRARSYDIYYQGHWETRLNDTNKIYNIDMPFLYGNWKDRKDIQMVFSPVIGMIQNVDAPSMPVFISREVSAIGERFPDGTFNISAIIADPPLRSGETFRVRSDVAQPIIKDLETAGTQYPDWVTQQYLQYPVEMSSKVVQLARQITKNATTPYDKVIAVTTYLRDNYEYTQTIPPIPEGKDPIEWFLFDMKKGFCNYYASAEVLMLRSIGIPARLAVGYAQGEHDTQLERFVIRSRDSHAWPEVFFPGLGWIEFEPTASQPATIYPESYSTNSNQTALTPVPTHAPQGLTGQLDNQKPINQGENGGLFSTTFFSSGFIIFLTIIAAIILILLIRLWNQNNLVIFGAPLPVQVERVIEKRGIRTPNWLKKWSAYTQLNPMERIFSEINRMLGFLRIRTTPDKTPAEKTKLLVEDLPEIEPLATILLDAYHRSIFGPYPADLTEAGRVKNDLWKKVVWLWFKRLVTI